MHPPMRSNSLSTPLAPARARAPHALLLGAMLGLGAAAAGLAACSGGDPDALLRQPVGGPGGPGSDPAGSGTTPGGGEPPPVVLECTEASQTFSAQGKAGQ